MNDHKARLLAQQIIDEMTPADIERVIERRDELVGEAMKVIEEQGREWDGDVRKAAEAVAFGRLGDGSGERLMAQARPDDYWPIAPVQEPTGAPTPADPHTALGGSGVDAHGDAEDEGEADEQPGWVPWAVGTAVVVGGCVLVVVCVLIGVLGLIA